MRRSRHNHFQKIEAVEKYKNGDIDKQSLSLAYQINPTTLTAWINNYDTFGPAGMQAGHNRSNYTDEFKQSAVRAYLDGEGTQAEICKRFQIRSKRQLQNWITMYTGHRKLHETKRQRRERSMTKRRVTTQDERLEIVSYCISHNKDYRETMEKYGVSYQQIYSWVSKYEKQGVDGLLDKRGKRKPMEEMDETERLRAENKMLKAQNELKELEILVLKKLQEIEGRRG